ncbi:MAG TPA: nicotinate-nucleotide adenylyltransferase [Bdellovibrionota bacterium]|nr:nicotinate-nucleotide adenylyltransferase [Bdellovibrionota bacterium]
MKIGIFGGSFNPVHNGHIFAAKNIQQQLNLDRLIFMPTYNTPLKDPAELEAPKFRLEMLELAIKDIPNVEVSTLEIDRKGVSYTVDTVTQIRKELTEEDELFWIIGMDSFNSIRDWKEYPKLFSLVHFVIISPPGFDFPLGVLPGTLISKYQRGEGLHDFVNKQGFRIIFFESPMMNIHSTEIRERLKADASVSKFLPELVLDYILEQGLYGVKRA